MLPDDYVLREGVSGFQQLQVLTKVIGTLPLGLVAGLSSAARTDSEQAGTEVMYLVLLDVQLLLSPRRSPSKQHSGKADSGERASFSAGFSPQCQNYAHNSVIGFYTKA